MSDGELDREWKPSNRPQSTMAKSFSLALNDLFKMDNSLADLDAAVSEKSVPLPFPPLETVLTTMPLTRKKAVSTQTSELEALEARLKATEERLKAKQVGGAAPSATGGVERTPSGRASPRQRTPLGDTFTSPTRTEHPASPLATEFASQTINREQRPSQNTNPSYSTPPMPGGMPPTPGASEGEYGSDSEYVLVEAARNNHANVRIQDGEMPPQARKNP
ncbi:hypothetical protein BJ875DRAFT_461235 [Amylocarpus encephaloides]|uniref:Uncharacterized protein n=1 Tax=Amylocarpus encephaloides TaxID=45428 RepID=A0A9P7YK51_9HELO|nr:hypothetical protein BJ875DRAFT_461235 [Amylocarpus encephaloides]